VGGSRWGDGRGGVLVATLRRRKAAASSYSRAFPRMKFCLTAPGRWSGLRSTRDVRSPFRLRLDLNRRRCERSVKVTRPIM